MGICYIFSAGQISDDAIVKRQFDREDMVICADGGYRHVRRLGIYPDVLVGDFDSIGQVPEARDTIRLSPEKDDTDTMYAVKLGLQNGYRKFILYGAMGGRLDHTLANLQTAAFVASAGGQATLVDVRDIVTVITNRTIQVPKTKGYSMSIFALGDVCTGVTLRGVKYPLTDATVSVTFPIGVSNEIVEDTATVTVKGGYLAVIKSKL